ncbi:MAG: protein YgfX [Gallionella sp.]|nr:protein YgfX [Gallionella sp.]
MVINSSFQLAGLLVAVHAVALIVLYLTDIPLLLRISLCLLTLVSLAYYLARDALLLLSHSWREVSFHGAELSVTERGHAHFSGTLAGDTVVTPYFILLGCLPHGRRFPIFRVIGADALGKEEFRQMCVVLRMA